MSLNKDALFKELNSKLSTLKDWEEEKPEQTTLYLFNTTDKNIQISVASNDNPMEVKTGVKNQNPLAMAINGVVSTCLAVQEFEEIPESCIPGMFAAHLGNIYYDTSGGGSMEMPQLLAAVATSMADDSMIEPIPDMTWKVYINNEYFGTAGNSYQFDALFDGHDAIHCVKQFGFIFVNKSTEQIKLKLVPQFDLESLGDIPTIIYTNNPDFTMWSTIKEGAYDGSFASDGYVPEKDLYYNSLDGSYNLCLQPMPVGMDLDPKMPTNVKQLKWSKNGDYLFVNRAGMYDGYNAVSIYQYVSNRNYVDNFFNLPYGPIMYSIGNVRDYRLALSHNSEFLVLSDATPYTLNDSYDRTNLAVYCDIGNGWGYAEEYPVLFTDTDRDHINVKDSAITNDGRYLITIVEHLENPSRQECRIYKNVNNEYVLMNSYITEGDPNIPDTQGDVNTPITGIRELHLLSISPDNKKIVFCHGHNFDTNTKDINKMYGVYGFNPETGEIDFEYPYSSLGVENDYYPNSVFASIVSEPEWISDEEFLISTTDNIVRVLVDNNDRQVSASLELPVAESYETTTLIHNFDYDPTNGLIVAMASYNAVDPEKPKFITISNGEISTHTVTDHYTYPQSLAVNKAIGGMAASPYDEVQMIYYATVGVDESKSDNIPSVEFKYEPLRFHLNIIDTGETVGNLRVWVKGTTNAILTLDTIPPTVVSLAEGVINEIDGIILPEGGVEGTIKGGIRATSMGIYSPTGNLTDILDWGESVASAVTFSADQLSDLGRYISDTNGRNYIRTLPDHIPKTFNSVAGMLADTRDLVTDVSKWDVSRVSVFNNTFLRSGIDPKYAQVGTWNVENGRYFDGMFKGSSLNPNLINWCVPYVYAYNVADFSTDGALEYQHTPMWGSCPRGEMVIFQTVDLSTLVVGQDKKLSMTLREAAYPLNGMAWNIKQVDTVSNSNPDVAVIKQVDELTWAVSPLAAGHTDIEISANFGMGSLLLSLDVVEPLEPLVFTTSGIISNANGDGISIEISPATNRVLVDWGDGTTSYTNESGATSKYYGTGGNVGTVTVSPLDNASLTSMVIAGDVVEVKSWYGGNVERMTLGNSTYTGRLTKLPDHIWNGATSLSYFLYNQSVYMGTDMLDWNVENVINTAMAFSNSIFDGDLTHWKLASSIDSDYNFLFNSKLTYGNRPVLATHGMSILERYVYNSGNATPVLTDNVRFGMAESITGDNVISKAITYRIWVRTGERDGVFTHSEYFDVTSEVGKTLDEGVWLKSPNFPSHLLEVYDIDGRTFHLRNVSGEAIEVLISGRTPGNYIYNGDAFNDQGITVLGYHYAINYDGSVIAYLKPSTKVYTALTEPVDLEAEIVA